MRPFFVIDEIHTTVLVHRDADPSEIRSIRRTLKRKAFTKRLEQATKAVIGRFPSMRHVQFTLSR